MAVSAFAGITGEPLVPPSDDLCLDYANTLSWRGSAAPAEMLSGFGDLLRWVTDSARLPARAIEAVGDWGREHPEAAAALFAEAILLREVIYRSFAALAAGDAVAAADLAALNEALAGTPTRARLARWERGYAWAAAPIGVSASGLLTTVLWSAADLLTRVDHRPLRRCANDQCLWLFLDHSKGGTRRWCDMTSCGNRAKSRRHYLKTKVAQHRPS